MPSNSSERIDDGLRDLSREVIPPGHMHAMLRRVETRVRRKDKMDRIIRRTAVAAGLCVVILAGLLFVPVSYDLHVGSLVRAEITAAGGTLALLSDGLPQLDGLAQVKAERVEDDIILWLGFWGKDADEARASVDAMLASLPNTAGGYRITAEEVVHRIGGNVLAWASGGRLIINGEGMSEEELEQAIVNALIANGAGEVDVDVQISEDGVSRIDIMLGEMEGDVSGDSLTIEIISTGGSTVTSE